MKNLCYIVSLLLLSIVMLICCVIIYFGTLESSAVELSKVLLPSIAPLITVLSALYIFKLQQDTERAIGDRAKLEEKQRLAATIYKEIKGAQDSIERIKLEHLSKKQRGVNDFAINEFSPPILPYESWNQNKHLFIKELNQENFDLIDASFNAALQAEDCRRWATSLFREQVTQKAASRMSAACMIAKDLAMEKLKSEITTIESTAVSQVPISAESIANWKISCERDFSMLTDAPSFIFKPKELNDRGDIALEQFKDVVNTPAGQQLRELCGDFLL
ncbi:hypothetical protein GBN24_12590 [Plesiomonas shigelloides]|uniref:hypothetical protein n=1 Tax=Plesiomonas shigelloides TaxID=703 RepID=UPI001261B07C|nr:hypothetical protein [Plesiomonas shigelloides]KAB7688387.1 hypothetical protein GBN24_12590 [Plesiomonas shigelloides]